MSEESKQIVFFIDRCLGNKEIPDTLRQAGITIKIHDNYFSQDAQDLDWMPEVGAKGWIILTKDAKISKNKLERIAVASAGIKMFILASQNLSGQDMANIFLSAISKMQEFVRKHTAPFIAKVYQNRRIEMWKDSVTLLQELEQI